MFIYPCDPRYEAMIESLPCVVEFDGLYWELRRIEGEYIFVAIDVYPDYEDENGQGDLQADYRRQSNI